MENLECFAVGSCRKSNFYWLDISTQGYSNYGKSGADYPKFITWASCSRYSADGIINFSQSKSFWKRVKDASFSMQSDYTNL